VPDSNDVTFSSAGTYYWQAAYSGDDDNDASTSACTSEVLVVNPNAPSIATQLSATTVAIGDPVHDSAALSGATADAGGSVTYTVYGDATCTTAVADAGTVSISNGTVPDSNDVTFAAAGTYYWQAAYSGDGNNDAATSECTTEIMVVNPNAPSITTSLSETSGTAGDSVHDSATLTGVTSDASGSVTFTVYSDAGCTSKFADAGTVTVTNGNVPDSNAVTFDQPGTYYWQAAYSGDSNNTAATSACTDEQLVLAAAPTTPPPTTPPATTPPPSGGVFTGLAPMARSPWPTLFVRAGLLLMALGAFLVRRRRAMVGDAGR
jgi:hypothetical protein